MDKEVLVVEPQSRGHHMVYAGLLIDRMVTMGWRPTLMTSRSAAASPPVIQMMNRHRDAVDLVTIDEPPCAKSRTALALTSFQVSFWNYLHNGFHSIHRQPSVVYCVNLDDFDKAMALKGSPFGEASVHGMLMHVHYHHRAMGVGGPGSRSDRLYDLVTRRLLSRETLRSLFVIDPTYAEFALRYPKPLREKVAFVADPVAVRPRGESHEECRRILGIPPDSFVVLLFGALSERKGIRSLVKAMADAAMPKHVHLVVAGEPDSSAAEVLQSEEAGRLRVEGRLTEKLEYVTETDERILYAASDVAWVAYEDFYSMSGVMITAHAFSKPVIGSREGLIGKHIVTHGSGITVNPADVSEIVKQIEGLSRDLYQARNLGSAGWQSVETNTSANFVEKITGRIADLDFPC